MSAAAIAEFRQRHDVSVPGAHAPREYYKRVTPPKDKQSEALSTHALATRRLGVLGDTAKLTKTAKRAK